MQFYSLLTEAKKDWQGKHNTTQNNGVSFVYNLFTFALFSLALSALSFSMQDVFYSFMLGGIELN